MSDTTAGSFAECPDCGCHLYLTTCEVNGITEAAWECPEPCEHGPLADRDVYLEHDETSDGRLDAEMGVALFIVRATETEES